MKINKLKIINIIIVLVLFCAIFYGTVGLLITGIKVNNLNQILFGSLSTVIFALIGIFGIKSIIKE